MSSLTPKETVHAHAAFETVAIMRIAMLVVAAGAVWFRVWEPSGVQPIGAAALILAGWPIFREAIANLLAHA